MSTKAKRIRYDKLEDKVLNLVLIQLYHTNSPAKSRIFNWGKEITLLFNTIMKNLLGDSYQERSASSLRQRYETKLNPNLSNEPFTKEEDDMLIQKVSEYNTQWKEINVFFPKRSPISLRNRYRMLEPRLHKITVVGANTFEDQFAFSDIFQDIYEIDNSCEQF